MKRARTLSVKATLLLPLSWLDVQGAGAESFSLRTPRGSAKVANRLCEASELRLKRSMPRSMDVERLSDTTLG